MALNLLRKLNYDVSRLRSKSWDEFAAPGAPKLDFVFTVCDDAANEVCPIWPGQPMTAHWGIPDPAKAVGPGSILLPSSLPPPCFVLPCVRSRSGKSDPVRSLGELLIARSEYETLFRVLCNRLGPHRLPLLIVVDGADGVGKSSLASWLAWQLEMPAVHLDLYLVRDAMPVCWREADLNRVIEERLDLGRPLIVEGFVALDALASVGRRPDFWIFVRGSGGHGLSKRISDYNSRREPESNADFVLSGFD